MPSKNDFFDWKIPLTELNLIWYKARSMKHPVRIELTKNVQLP